MKINAIYTLITAVIVSALPTPAPQPAISPAELQLTAEQAGDRAFDDFGGEPITLAWESGSSVNEPSAPVLDGPADLAIPAAETLADDGSAAAEVPGGDDSGFAAFSQLGEVELDAADGGQSEWDLAGSLADQAAATAERLGSVAAAAGGGAEGGETVSGAAPVQAPAPALMASGFESGSDTPRSASMTIETVSPDQVDQAGQAPVAEAADPAAESAPADQIVSDDEGMWIRGARLNDVFQYLARLGQLQYFHNSDLDAPNYVVTGHLQDGDPERQMEELGLMYGITIHRKGATVYAMTNAQLSQLPTKPFQYQLRYLRSVDIDQIKAILTTMLTPGSGIIEYEPKTNTLIIIDNEQKIETIQGILAEMDRPKLQIAIETRILRINTDSSNKIGVDWTSVLGDGLTIDAEESLNALFGLPDSDQISEVVTRTSNLLTTDSSSNFGESSFSLTESGNLLNGALNGDTTGNFTGTDSNTSTYESTSLGESGQSFARNQAVNITGSNLVLSPVQLSATIRALNAGGLAQQESSPTLITEDNEEAIISIIDRIPIIISTLSETTAGQNVSEEVRYRIDPDDPTISEDPAKTREIGVSVAVIPTILPDNTIRMALRPRSAQITDYVVGRSGNVFPRVNESSVETIARIPNGNSLLIGGFYEEVEGSKENKVPILGDIPGLKFFFSSSEKTKNHTSLIFVVTPKLYEPASSVETLTTTRDLQERHVVPGDHAWPDRHHPGNGYEANLGWTMGNMVDAYDPIPPSNPLNPDHPVNRPPEEGWVGQQRPFVPEPEPAPQPKRRGLLHRLFNNQDR